MHKSNTNSDNGRNIKTIEKLPQVKISDSSIILYLQRCCSEVIIRQYSKAKNSNCTVNHWKRMIK